MGRKTQYKPKTYESYCSLKDTSANIYVSMLTSEAWKDLTASQKVLYLSMKAEKYRQKRKPVQMDGDNPYFTFNMGKWLKGKEHSYELYSNKNQFYRDKKALIEHGFIEVKEPNRFLRKADVLRYSNGWTHWTHDTQKKPP